LPTRSWSQAIVLLDADIMADHESCHAQARQ
jgi:hypothetical protein